jgi:hypothetical protein
MPEFFGEKPTWLWFKNKVKILTLFFNGTDKIKHGRTWSSEVLLKVTECVGAWNGHLRENGKERTIKKESHVY